VATEDPPPLNRPDDASTNGSLADWTPSRDVTIPVASDTSRALAVIDAIAAFHRRHNRLDSAASLGDVLATVGPAARQDRGVQPDLSKGEPWGPLIVLEPVGGGSFGDVYRAWDPALDHEVALKRLRLPAGTPSSQAASIVREGQLLARVRHQNVITVHGACEIKGEIGIWMEFVRGKTLEQIVQDGGPMSAEEASIVGESLCRALAAVHQAGLLHRDVKASNIMREAGGRLVILDFGSTREIDPVEGSSPHRLVGTPLYMAPELFHGSPASVQSDIYSLGVLLFYLTTRSYPVKGSTLAQIRSAHLAGARSLLSDVRPDLPRGFVRLVERALFPEPDSRYQTAGAVLADLKEFPIATPDRSIPFSWIGAGVLALILLPLLAGLVTSFQFNLSLGRVGGFTEEPLTAYWVYGFNALFAPLVYMLATALLCRFATGLCRQTSRLLLHFAPRRWADRARSFRDTVRRRCHNLESARLLDALILAQLVALGLVCWIFSDMLYASLARLSVSDPEIFRPLRSGSNVRHAYRISFSITIMAMTAAWATVIQRARTPLNRTAVTAGLALIGIVLMLLVLPYRMTWKNELERVEFKGTRCYITGNELQNLLLYCPDAHDPRVIVVPRDDSDLKRLNRIESIFSTG
jgi:Protein kinase domain